MNTHRSIVAWIVAVAFLPGFFQHASAADIELGAVGNDSQPNPWCVTDHKKIKAGEPVKVIFRGRSLLPSATTGRIVMTNQTHSRFVWSLPPLQENFTGNENLIKSTILQFTTAMAPLQPVRNRNEGSIDVRAITPPGIYTLFFLGEDSRGERTTTAQPPGCRMEVVRHIPDVEAVSIEYTPSPGGTPHGTLRMTIRNNTAAESAPLATVPWSISLQRRNGMQTTTQVLASGSQSNVAPGNTFTVTSPFTFPRTGVSFLDQITGRADPFNE
ncbi:MAG TPA: hypothetical protein VJS66_08705, partial [Burkholderiales bacterium]|nr:hypothetical protein [Burkholderiales bacterium]